MDSPQLLDYRQTAPATAVIEHHAFLHPLRLGVDSS